ncbi:MAG: hypothetical protein ACT4PG_13560, partial [Panacagrimonas sp.]
HCLALELIRVLSVWYRRSLAHLVLRSSENDQPSDVRQTKAGSGNAVCYYEALRLGFRDRLCAMHLSGLFLFIPHDTDYVLLWEKWFVEYDHWFLKLFWVALVFTVLAAWAFLFPFLRYGQREWMPQVSRPTFIALVLGGLLMSTGVWLALKSVLQDELFLFAFGLTGFWCAPFGMGLMLRRGHRGAQSAAMWIGYTAIPVFYWIAAALYLGPYFQSPVWLVMGVAATIWGLANVVLLKQLPSAGGQGKPTPAVSSIIDRACGMTGTRCPDSFV